MDAFMRSKLMGDALRSHHADDCVEDETDQQTHIATVSPERASKAHMAKIVNDVPAVPALHHRRGRTEVNTRRV